MTPQRTTHDGPCEECGKHVEREIPDDLIGTRFAPVLWRLPLYCDSCLRDAEHAEALEEDAERNDRIETRQREANMPRLLAGLGWEDVEIDDDNRGAIEAAKRWGDGEISGLALAGPVGVGKTYIAGAAANALLQRRPVRWFSAARLMAQAKAGFANPARDEVTELLLKPTRALVLDDIDKVSPTDYGLEILYELIDERVNNGTPLLVTTNLTYPEVEEQFGEPIASRLKTCHGHRIEGKDRRRRS